jgi:PST family polysaccharide transporter
MAGRFGLRQFARSAGVLSLSSLANFIRAVVAAKVLAVTLGPSTVGVLAQILNFSALLAVIIPLGLTTGVSKMVAEAGSAQQRVNKVVIASSVISLGSGLCAAIVLAPFAGAISEALTGSAQYRVLVLFIVASLPLYNLAGVLGYVLQGLADVNRLTWANVSTGIISLVVLVPLTVAFGLRGAVGAVLITSFVQAAVFAWAVSRAYAVRAWRIAVARIERRTVMELLSYGGVVLVGSVVSWASVLIVRTLTLRVLGETANGLYQVVFGLSTQYITIFMTWMAAYVFPRIVSEAKNGKLGQLLNSGLRANLAIMVPILVVAISLREPLIRIFYSPAFESAAPLIPPQVLGDYARIVGWSFAVCLFAIGHTRSHLAVVTVQSIAWVILAGVMVPVWGLPAVPVSYSISFLAYPLLGIALVRRWVGTWPDRTSWLLTGLGLACVFGAGAPAYASVLLAPIMPATVYLLNRYELNRT